MDPLYQHLHLYEQTGGETFILRALKAFDPPIHFSDYLFRTSFEGEINCSVLKEERLKGRIGMNAAMTQLCKALRPMASQCTRIDIQRPRSC